MTMKNAISILLYVIIFLYSNSIWGGTTYFSQFNYTFLTEDIGLPNNYVKFITKDSDGYIWATTHNGLARYDGYNFTTFNASSNPVRLKGDVVYKVCEDNFRRLWVVSEGGIDVIDLNKYENVNFNITKYSALWNIMNTHVSNIYKDKDGNLWISALNTLYHIKLDKQGNINDYYYLEKSSSQHVVNSVIDMKWGICADINNSLCTIEISANHLLKCNPVSKMTAATTNDWIISCMALDNEILWIGTNKGLYRYDHYGRNIKRYSYDVNDNSSISNSYITDIKFTPEGKMLVATMNGINYYVKSSDNFIHIKQDNEFKEHSLNCNIINCIFTEGNRIWIGTEIGGINLLTSSRLNTIIWQNRKKDPYSLSANPVSAINMDREGNLWVGTVEGGINIKRKGENRFEHFVNIENLSSSISHNSVSGLLIDNENHLWAYTWGGGINELNLNEKGNKILKRYSSINTPQIKSDYISSACEDLVNRGIWFGSPEGLLFYKKQTGEFMMVQFNIPDNRFEAIRALYIDKQSKLWVGTTNGLFIIDLFSFALSHRNFDYKYYKKLSDPSLSIADKINSIIGDKDGNIWLGTDGAGLYKYFKEEKGLLKFHNFTMKDGLPNNNIIGIVEDMNRNLWLSTNHGISKFDTKKKTFSNFTKYDGLLNNQFYWNAYYYSKSENIVYFGNIDGLVGIHPSNLKEKSDNVVVSLTDLIIQGENIYPASGDYISENISSANEINIHERDHGLEIYFSAKDYAYNNQISYAYRLKGYESEWNETKRGEHSAKYTSIPPGDYVFEVKATDDKGNWSGTVTEIEVHVSPYFYKSWWFYIICFIIVAVCSERFYVWKTNAYKHQKKILEDTVQQRTSQLAIQNEKLIEMSKKLAETTEEKITFFTNITHEFRTPVTLINGPIEQAIKSNKDPEVNQQLKLAERSSKYLLALVNELMDFRKIDAQKVQLDKKCEDFEIFLENAVIPFKAFAGDRNISLNILYHLSNNYIVLDYDYMKRVIVNLVSNAIKFTPNNGTINIYITSLNYKDNSLLYICVEDNGAGIDKKDLTKIFERFYQSKTSVKYPVQGQSSTGIGLYLCKKIIEMHGGEIYAINNKKGGTSIRTILPLVNGDISTSESSMDNNEEKAIEINIVPSNSETILIVDDNEDMRIYVKTLLQQKYNILQASNGEEALELISNQKVDLILSDIMMPVMNGIELSKRVKENLSISHIPFIMLTAIVSEEQKKESFEIGVDEYLCKPFDEEILLLKIRNIFAIQKKYKAKFAVSMNSENIAIAEDSKDKKFFDRAVSLMKESYSNAEYDIENFVSDMGYSKTLVNSKLQALIGQSIGQFMKNYRLNNAHEYIIAHQQCKDINIAEIAYRVGFNDPKYFSKCFKEMYGVLPSALLSKK